MLRLTLNGQEQSCSSFRIPDSSIIDLTANTTTHIEFTPIMTQTTVYLTIIIAILEPLFPIDRFNPLLLQPNISSHSSIINRFTDFFKSYNSMGIRTNGTTFDRFLQPFSVPQGTTTMSPSSVPVISVPSVAQTIPTAGHTSLFPMAANNNGELSAPSSISLSLVNDQPYRYLLPYGEQTKIAEKAATHYTNLTEHLMEHGRSAAAEEEMPLLPLSQAVVSTVQNCDPPKDSLQHLQQQKEDEEKDQQPTYQILRNMAPFPPSDMATSCELSDEQQIPCELLGQKRLPTDSLFISAFCEPMMKARN
uniref:HSF_DOMAIN domain-containing protein n=1 Tax=Elaeophora elaphi TaxID=1147741 RepID=A0A0R3S3B9_9BILA